MITTQKYAHGDTPLAELSDEVKQAADAILEMLERGGDEAWTPRALMDASTPLLNVAVSNTVMSIAFWNLVENGVLTIDEQLTVSRAKLA